MAKSRRNNKIFLAAKSKVINPQQLGGIETSILDNGPGKGTRIAWVNTGSELRYKVAIDRGLDIADAFFGPHSLTWHSFGGMTAASRALDRGIDWLRGFYGGLLVSCGPTHVGPPTTTKGQEYGLHGPHSNTPATLESVVNPDLPRRQTTMSITGTVRTARVFGPNIELRRTISSELGQASIHIADTIRNVGNDTAPHAWLLHINFGYPLLDAGTEFLWSGTLFPRVGDEAYFKSVKKIRVVPQPLNSHRGFGEAAGFIKPKIDRNKMASVGVYNPKLGVALEIRCSMKQFQTFVHWQHWGPAGEYVAALEPLSIPPWDKPRGDFKSTSGHLLRAGQSRSYETTITIHNSPSAIAAMRRRVAGKK